MKFKIPEVYCKECKKYRKIINPVVTLKKIKGFCSSCGADIFKIIERG